MKKICLSLLAMIVSMTTWAIGAISASGSICTGSSVYLTDTTAGGTWSSSDTSIATISSSGLMTGVGSGSVVMTYTVGSSYAVLPMHVFGSADPIVGTRTLCAGATTTLSIDVTGGTWSISPTSVATIGAVSGVVTGVAYGTATVTYAFAAGCMQTTTVTVAPTAGPITGPRSVCAGGAVSLGDTVAGGIWSISPTSVATISSFAGVVTGVSAGTAVVTYWLGTGCEVTMPITVNVSPAAITGGSSLCTYTATTLSDVTGGGYWSSSNPAIGTVGSTTGVVTGTGSGIDTISYTLGTGCTSSTTVTVNIGPPPFTGPFTTCIGVPDTLLYGIGAYWSSSPTTVGTISSSGVFHGVNPGVATITCAAGASCVEVFTITVEPTPAAIVGSATVCTGGADYLSDATPGGRWSTTSSLFSLAYITGTTEVITAGSSTGTGVITFTSAAGCSISVTMTVAPTPPPMTMPSTLCVGDAVAASDAMSGGTWAISPTSVATIGFSGVVGLSPGTAVIHYIVSGCTTSETFTVNPTPSAITGPSSVCAYATIVLSDVPPGGIWSSSSPGVAVIDSTRGYLTGLAAGTDVIHYTLPGTGCSSSFVVTVAATPAPMLGRFSICPGDTTTVSEATPGGTWSVGTSACTMLSPGVFVGVSAGVTGITYTMPAGCAEFVMLTVNPAPNIYAMTGGGAYCAGGTGAHIGLAASEVGVNYQLLMGGTAAGLPIAGTGSSLDLGRWTAGTYTMVATDAATLCSDTMSGSTTVSIITTTTTATVAITASPGTTVCAGTSVTFSTISTGGGSSPAFEWFINAADVASTASLTYFPNDGDVVGVVMTSSASCVSPLADTASVAMRVYSPAVTATATAALCGDSYNMSASGASSYTWSPATGLSCTGCSTPVCSGLSASITYSVTGVDGHGCVATPDTVTANFNRIYGNIYYTGGSSSDVFRVWLIQYNPSDSSITATDSTNTCMDSGIPYYEFSSPAAGNYMVKAKLDGTVPGSSGYMPTYSYSSSYWYLANTDAHTTSADTMNISMIYDTVPSGPGFISGYVYAGAGRGTSGDVPAVGMTIYLKNALTGHVVSYMVTDGTGYYAFSGIALGDYYVYPELFSYHTTQSSPIALTADAPADTGVDFKQHTTYSTITPLVLPATGVQQIAGRVFEVYPNPTNGVVNIRWQAQEQGRADVVVTDVAGREVWRGSFDMNGTSGNKEMMVSDLQDGLYLLTIKAGELSYTGKLLIER